MSKNWTEFNGKREFSLHCCENNCCPVGNTDDVSLLLMVVETASVGTTIPARRNPRFLILSRRQQLTHVSLLVLLEMSSLSYLLSEASFHLGSSWGL